MQCHHEYEVTHPLNEWGMEKAIVFLFYSLDKRYSNQSLDMTW